MDLKRCKLQKEYITTKKESEYTRVDRKYQKYVTETERVVAGWVLELPMHILFDILSRLPMETVSSCKCVCKTFLKILTDRYFAELHLTKAPIVDHSLIVQSRLCPFDVFLAYTSDFEKPSPGPSWKYDFHSSSRPWRNLDAPPIVDRSNKKILASLIGSCNGLLYLSYYQGGLASFYVCNPILGEFMILPQIRSYAHSGGFGFCPKTKLYKVIRFVTTTYCEIHTLGTNWWRRIENAPYLRHPDSMSSSLNGYLHWITQSSNISSLICALNLESEQLHYISLPSQFNRDTIERISCMNAGAKGGLFCVFYLLDEAQLEVFVMKEYGVESSWTKEFTVNLKFDFLRQPIRIFPMKLLNNGDVLVCYNYTNLVYFSSQRHIYKELMVPFMCDIMVFAPSFVSLKDIAGGKSVEVVTRNGSGWEIEKCPHETGFGVVEQDASQGVEGHVDDTYPIPLLWSSEEVLRLQQAVPHSRYKTRTNTRIAWGTVAQEVGTRTRNQCKWKWQCMRKLGLV